MTRSRATTATTRATGAARYAISDEALRAYVGQRMRTVRPMRYKSLRDAIPAGTLVTITEVGYSDSPRYPGRAMAYFRLDDASIFWGFGCWASEVAPLTATTTR